MQLPIPAEVLALRSKLLRGLADPARLALLEALRAGPHTVGELVVVTGMRQPNISNHLACLRDCGLVTSTQQGRYVRYQLSDPRVAALIRLTDELLEEVARGIAACARYTQAVREDAA